MKKFHRGRLADDNRVIESPGLQQAWALDATGNWKSFTTFDPADAARTLDQQRRHNAANEITGVARTVGAAWATPAFDRNGSMTGDERGRHYRYDPWNRLVEARGEDGDVVAEYEYDGLGRRTRETHGPATRDLYYSARWQVLEERDFATGDATTQYVWGPAYVDALVLRDRDADGDGTLGERLWALQDANWNVVAVVGPVEADGAAPEMGESRPGAPLPLVLPGPLETTAPIAWQVTERYAYEAYGVRTIYLPNYEAAESVSRCDWRYGFQGLSYQSDTHSYNVRLRDLDTYLGRWFQRDPLGFDSDDHNLYRSFEGNPLIKVDPFGEYATGIELVPNPANTKPIIINGVTINCNGNNFDCFRLPEAIGAGPKDQESCDWLTRTKYCCSIQQAYIARECCYRAGKVLDTCAQFDAGGKGFYFNCEKSSKKPTYTAKCPITGSAPANCPGFFTAVGKSCAEAKRIATESAGAAACHNPNAGYGVKHCRCWENRR